MLKPHYKKPVFLFCAALLIGAAGAWWIAQPESEQAINSTTGDTARQQKIPERRDVPVIIYLVDTLRADRLGLYGHDQHVTSPRIDALAAESVVFDRAYAPGPWTLPSVTSLVTSTFACEHQMLETMKTQAERRTAVGPGPALKTLAEQLHSINFLTGGFYANSVIGKSSGLHRGYDEYVLRKSFVTRDARLRDIQAFLDRAGRTPFFLYIHTMEPHGITNTPARFIRRIGNIDLNIRRPVGNSILVYNGLRHADWKLGNPLGTTDNTPEQQQIFTYLEGLRESIKILYDAAVLRADTNLGDLVQVLRDKGLWDKAIFIFLSDHGEELGEHGGWFHGQSVYEELMRVPLIIHFPDGEFAGQRIDEPVSLVDIMPTIFDYLRRPELCDGCRGTSLLPLLREPSDSGKAGRSIPALRINTVNYYRPWKESRGDINVIVRQDRWKGIWNDELRNLELYDLEQDPGERSNVSAEEPEVGKVFSDRARAWLKDCWAQAKQPEELGEIDEESQERLRALGYFN
jgi:arylsulfatase A-like enzyme